MSSLFNSFRKLTVTMRQYIRKPDNYVDLKVIEACGQVDYWSDYICKELVQLECDPIERQEFFGQIRSKQLTEIKIHHGIASSQKQVRPSSSVSSSADNPLFVTIQLQGKGRFSQNGREQILEPGDMVFNDSSLPSQWDFNDKFEQLIYQIPRSLFSLDDAGVEQVGGHKLRRDSTITNLLANYMLDAVKAIGIHRLDAKDEQFMSKHLIQMIVKAIRLSMQDSIGRSIQAAENSMPDSDAAECDLEMLLFYIRENFHLLTLSVESLAEEFSISRRQVYKLFERGNLSPAQYIADYRMKQFAERLISPVFRNLSISEISLSCGIANLSHVSRIFRSRYSESPREYRRKYLLFGLTG